jgi:hypothetical protein
MVQKKKYQDSDENHQEKKRFKSGTLRKNEELAINEELDVRDPGPCLSDAVSEAGHLGFLKQKTRHQ